MKRFLIIVVFILLLLQAVPFLIPLSRYTYNPEFKPYANSFYFEDSGVPIHYRLFMPTTSRVKGKVFFVHGLGGSTESFTLNAPSLIEQGYIVVSVDLPGFGYSARGTNFSHGQTSRARQLWSLLEVIDYNASLDIGTIRWDLAGHSMGGGTVSAMAVSRPDRTRSLILIDGALSQSDRSSDGGLLFYPPVSRWTQVILEHVLIKEKRIASILKSAYGRDATAEEVQRYLKPLSVKGTARGAIHFAKSSESLPLSELERYSGPAFAIWGSRDNWVPISELDEIEKHLPKIERFVIDGAGHLPHETHAGVFNEALNKFLETRP
ncbi:MAG TPA: hypothetical protein DCS67_01035 [Clostridiales bacterium UBA8960]|jgi:pimeloyl-ACP methyl ester carboxylesterase|nr:hypothetical protein [Clostridiales bacterium UBA8960]